MRRKLDEKLKTYDEGIIEDAGLSLELRLCRAIFHTPLSLLTPGSYPQARLLFQDEVDMEWTNHDLLSIDVHYSNDGCNDGLITNREHVDSG